MLDDFNFDPDQFNDENETTLINKTILSLTEKVIVLLNEMKDHISFNEKQQYRNKLSYLMNRLSQIGILVSVEDNPEITEEEIKELCKDAEERATEIDYNELFSIVNDGEEVKKGLNILDYIKDPDKDDPFGF